MYLNGQRIAIQNLGTNNTTQNVWWLYENPATGATRGTTNKLASEPDPLGVNYGISAPPPGPPDYGEGVPDLIIPRFADVLNLAAGCTADGQPISCDIVASGLDNGAFAQCPNNDCGSRLGIFTDRKGNQTNFVTGGFQARADGTSGFGIPADIMRAYEIDSMLAGMQIGGLRSFVNFFDDPVINIGNFEVTVTDDTPKDSLSSCVAGLFSQFFPRYTVNGVTVNIADDARFIKGIPFLPKHFATITPAAVTYGLYSIYYDDSTISLSSPTWDNLFTIAEELAHSEQFIQMWQNMSNVRSSISGAGGSITTGDLRRPTYEEAQNQWAKNYISAAADAYMNGFESYDNKFEKDAKQQVTIFKNRLIAKYNQQWQNQTKLCP